MIEKFSTNQVGGGFTSAGLAALASGLIADKDWVVYLGILALIIGTAILLIPLYPSLYGWLMGHPKTFAAIAVCIAVPISVIITLLLSDRNSNGDEESDTAGSILSPTLLKKDVPMPISGIAEVTCPRCRMQS